MIALVDDDQLLRAMLRQVLVAQGFEVEDFADATAALARLGDAEPELIVSDVIMPGLDGLAFRAAYVRTFPWRRTPFLFLSGLGGDGDQVRGLEAGADDYLVKPVSPLLLAARVRACLRRAGPAPEEPTFQGDLAHCPFARLVEFCEAQGFTGCIEVRAEGLTVAVPVHGGHLDPCGAEHTALIDRLFDLQQGAFVLRPRAPDFGSLPQGGQGAAPAGALAAPAQGQDRDHPVGRLSALPVGTRQLQLQTEFSTTPCASVVSVAVLEGRTVFKRVSGAAGPDRAARQAQVDAQHAEVEREIGDRLTVLAARREAEPAAESPQTRRDALIERGLAAFLAGQHREALEAWEEAARLDPDHRSLQVNLGVVRRKLAAA